MFFSIASQSVALPGSPAAQLVFAVDAADTSLCTLTANGHTLTFRRNGGLLSVVEIDPPKHDTPLAGYKSVNDDAVRAGEPGSNPNKIVASSEPTPPKPADKPAPPAPKPPDSPVPTKPLTDKTVTSTSLDQNAPSP